MKKIKFNVSVEIENIHVKGDGYYSFDYTINLNGKIKKGSYDSDYSNQTASAFRKVLERGYAVRLVFEQYF